MLIIMIHEWRRYKTMNQLDRSFFLMISLTLLNCLPEIVTGLCYSQVISNEAVLAGASQVARVLSLANFFFWLYFTLQYVKFKEPYFTILLVLDGLFVLTGVILVSMRVFNPPLFESIDGLSLVDTFRESTVLFQDTLYILLACYAVIKVIQHRKPRNRHNPRRWAVCIASLVALIFSPLQMMFPGAPFTSISLATSALTLYIYVVSYEREELQQSKELFLKNMSHEIRTTLNSVYGFSQLLCLPEGTWTDEERNSYAMHIQNSYNMLDMLLNDLMVSTRYDTHQYSVNIASVDVTSVVRDAVEAVNVCKPASVEVSLSSQLPDGFTIQSDGRRIRQIVQNLLTNSCQFISTGKILMDLRQNNHIVEISVAASIPYTQGHTYYTSIVKSLSDHRHGLGMRLRISQKMAKLLDGRVYRDIQYTDGIKYMFELNA